MKAVIIAALIGAAATIVAAILGMPVVNDWLSSRMRQRSNIPEIMGTKWSAEWGYEDGRPPLNDIVTFSKWTKNNQFEGFGEITHQGKQYRYSITGEVSPSRVVVLTYKAERYPTEANIGTACLQLSDNAEEFTGTWIGFAATTLRGGRLTMRRIRKFNP